MIEYIRYNSSRKAEFQLITKVILEDNKRYIIKNAHNDISKPFLLSIIDKYEILKKGALPFKLIEPKHYMESIKMDFVEGENLLTKLIKYFKQSEYSSVKELFEVYVNKIIKHLPRIEQPKDLTSFNIIFGESLDHQNDWVLPGCLDLNLDNFIEYNGEMYFIDYEWVWNFPIPRYFILYRSIYQLITLFSSYGLNANRLKELLNFEYDEDYMYAEYKFQCYVNISMPSFDVFKSQLEDGKLKIIHKDKIQIKNEKINLLQKELENYDESLRIRNKLFHELEQKYKSQQNEIDNLKSEVNALKNRKIIKIIDKLKNDG